MDWAVGDVVVERNVWRGQVLMAMPTVVLGVDDDAVVTYTVPGTAFAFVDGVQYPNAAGRSKYHGRVWEGHGRVVITPRHGLYAVQHFWMGPERTFACWYLNIQEPMRPTPIGFDTQDLELDVVVMGDGTWLLKDDELLEERVDAGRWSSDEVAAIRDIGERIVRDVLEPKAWWWDRAWADWTPDMSLAVPALPEGWQDVPITTYEGLLGQPDIHGA